MIDDSTLTTQGLPAKGEGRVLLLACGALAHEIIALKNSNGWDHLDLHCLPAIYHVHPEKIVPAIKDAVAKHRDSYKDIFVVYADCGTGGMLSGAEEYVAERLAETGARLMGYGQEINDDSYAICVADAMLKGRDATDHTTGRRPFCSLLPIRKLIVNEPRACALGSNCNNNYQIFGVFDAATY